MPLSAPDLEEIRRIMERFTDDENRRERSRVDLREHEQKDDRLHQDAQAAHQDLRDRVVKLETYMEIRSEDLSDTKRWRLTELGVLREMAPKEKEKPDSLFPRLARELFKNKLVIAGVATAIGSIVTHVIHLLQR